jgi:hypothetical protein
LGFNSHPYVITISTHELDNLDTLNNNNSLDFLDNYNLLLNEQDDFDNPYLLTEINCKFSDINSLPLNPISTASPCYVSIKGTVA